MVCYLSFRWSVHLSVRPCFCLCACSPVVGRTACFLRLRPSASRPSSPSIKPSVCRAPGARTRGALIVSTRLIQAPTDFLTLPNPIFFRSSLIQRGTKKTWICRPDQKASPEPSKAQSKGLSKGNRQRKSAANPPLIRAHPRKSAPRFANPLLFALPGP